MRIGINLRGDLAKLDDVEIAAKYEMLIAEKERQIRELPDYAKYRLFRWLSAVLLPGRGLLHAPVFYKIQAGILVGICFVAALCGGGGTWVTPDTLDDYLLDCELKDTRDEIKCRVRRRKLVAAS